jgi:hypothetical protein
VTSFGLWDCAEFPERLGDILSLGSGPPVFLEPLTWFSLPANCLAQHSVNPQTDAHLGILRLEVNIGTAGIKGVSNQRLRQIGPGGGMPFRIGHGADLGQGRMKPAGQPFMDGS